MWEFHRRFRVLLSTPRFGVRRNVLYPQELRRREALGVRLKAVYYDKSSSDANRLVANS